MDKTGIEITLKYYNTRKRFFIVEVEKMGIHNGRRLRYRWKILVQTSIDKLAKTTQTLAIFVLFFAKNFDRIETVDC